MTLRLPHRRPVLVALVALALWTPPATAQPLDSLRYASDITLSLGATLVGGGVLASDDLGGSVVLVGIATLPAAARVAAAHRFDNGNLLLAFESTVAVGAAGFVEPRDLVIYDATLETFQLVLEGASVGIPDGAHIDGVTRLDDGTTLLSLDVSVGSFDDEDVLQVDGPGLALYLDLSAVGFDPTLDVDGLDVEESGSVRLFVSADGSGSVDGVRFDDEDVLVYDLGDQAWSLAFDASASTPAWPAAADLIALDVALEATPTPTASATPTATVTPTFTATAPPPTETATSTPPPATETATATSPPATATATGVPTATDTRAPTSTATVQPSAPTATVTNTPIATATGPLATATDTRVPTSTATIAPSAPVTSTNTPLATATTTQTATAVVTTTEGPACPGDCNGSGEVTIDELITLVNIALGSAPVSACPVGDLDHNGAVTINEIVAAVGSALNGCP